MKSLLVSSAMLVSIFRLSGQNFIDTIQYVRGGYIYIETYDENAVLRLDCQYSGDDTGRLLSETVYLPDGKEYSKSIWYWHGLEENHFQLDSVTGKTNFMEIDSSGNILEISECSDSISNSKCFQFYQDGNLKAFGTKRLGKVFWVDCLDKYYIGNNLLNPPCKILPTEVKTGFWKYCYLNGNDSAFGNYYETGFYFEDSTHYRFDYNEYQGITFVMSYLSTENKTGTWQYFSPDGKLICKEEWDKGTLIVRQNY